MCREAGSGVRGEASCRVDLGGNRSWSACAAIWPSGRIEIWALLLGVPSLARSRASRSSCRCHSYSELVKSGGLVVDEGRACPRRGAVARADMDVGAAGASFPIRTATRNSPRRSRGRCRGSSREGAIGGGEATSNIQSLRSLLLDSNAGVVEESRALLAAAFQQTDLVMRLSRINKGQEARSPGAAETTQRPRSCWLAASWQGVLRRSSIEGSVCLEKRGSDVALDPAPPRSGSTRRWRKLRAYVLRRDGGRCQRCGGTEIVLRRTTSVPSHVQAV